jgi:hypothetical protein
MKNHSVELLIWLCMPLEFLSTCCAAIKVRRNRQSRRWRWFKCAKPAVEPVCQGRLAITDHAMRRSLLMRIDRAQPPARFVSMVIPLGRGSSAR